MGDYPIAKVPSLFPGQWGIVGSDSALGVRWGPTTRVFYVSSTHALANNANDGTDPNFPLATLAGAIAKCAANDWIILAPRHAETLIAAAAIAVNVAGLTIIGVGNGAARPTFTFQGVVGTDIDFTSANVHIENILCVGNLDGLTNPLHLAAADLVLKDIEWRDTSNAIEAVRAILTTTAADRLTIIGFIYSGWATGDACVNAFRLNGVDTGHISGCRFYGVVTTGWIEMITTLSSNLVIENCYFSCAGFGMTRNIVNTGPVASTGQVLNCYDAILSKVFSGGLVAALPQTVEVFINSLEKSDGAAPAGQDNLFVIAGGPIMVTEFYGYCVTAPGGATNCHIDETVIDPAADVPLSTDVAIDAIIAGGLISFSVAAPGVLTITAPGVLEATPAIRWILPPGTIKSHTSVARAAFVCRWFMRFQPLSPLSVVTVAP